MNILWYLHWLLPISVIILPFLDHKVLIYIFWYPIAYYLIWIIFDGCPLNKYHNNDKEDFLLEFLRKNISKTITEKQFNRMIGLFLGSIVVLSAYKIISNCKFNK